MLQLCQCHGLSQPLLIAKLRLGFTVLRAVLPRRRGGACSENCELPTLGWWRKRHLLLLPLSCPLFSFCGMICLSNNHLLLKHDALLLKLRCALDVHAEQLGVSLCAQLT